MNNQEELEYQLYLIRSAISDCIDSLDLKKNRETFLLYYGISAQDAHEIDKLFVKIALKDEKISFSSFSKKLNERLSISLAPTVIKELLEAYKKYEPVAIPKIEN